MALLLGTFWGSLSPKKMMMIGLEEGAVVDLEEAVEVGSQGEAPVVNGRKDLLELGTAFCEEEKALIRLALTNAKKMTSGEITPVVVRQSDTYPSSRWQIAVVFSLLT